MCVSLAGHAVLLLLAHLARPAVGEAVVRPQAAAAPALALLTVCTWDRPEPVSVWSPLPWLDLGLAVLRLSARPSPPPYADF